MKVTNKDNLPLVIANYREFDANHRYSRGKSDYSVTTLIDSPRIRKLFSKHHNEIEVDASENIFAMLGGAMHHIVERGASYDHEVEERLYLDIGGKRISGAIDLQEFDGKNVDLYDFKVTSVWAYIMDDMAKPDWISQQNCYATLVEENKPGLKVRSINVCILFRDWSQTESTRRRDYPPKAIMSKSLPLWSKAKRMAFLKQRVKMHAEADDMGDSMPMCSDSDRWVRPGKFALMKKGRKSAVKLFDSEEALFIWAHANSLTKKATKGAETLAPAYSIEERPKTYVRCESWCDVAPFCSQLKAEQLINQSKGTYFPAGDDEGSN